MVEKALNRARPRLNRTVTEKRIEQQQKREHEVEVAERAVLKPTVKELGLSEIQLSAEFNRLKLTLDDVKKGEIEKDDPDREQKAKELEEIGNMAKTMASNHGVIYIPFAFALPGGRCELIDGHRRFYAQLYKAVHIDKIDPASISEAKMDLRVYPTKPPEQFMIEIATITGAHAKLPPLPKLLAWAARRNEIEVQNNGTGLGADFFKETFNLGTSQATKYNKIVTLPSDEFAEINDALEKGVLSNLDQAHQIASISNKRVRQQKLNNLKKKKTGRVQSTQVSLGKTENLDAVKGLISLAADKRFLKELDESTNWDSVKDVEKAFKKFMKWWLERYDN